MKEETLVLGQDEMFLSDIELETLRRAINKKPYFKDKAQSLEINFLDDDNDLKNPKTIELYREYQLFTSFETMAKEYFPKQSEFLTFVSDIKKDNIVEFLKKMKEVFLEALGLYFFEHLDTMISIFEGSESAFIDMEPLLVDLEEKVEPSNNHKEILLAGFYNLRKVKRLLDHDFLKIKN